MSIKKNIKFCGTTNIPEGIRVVVTSPYDNLNGQTGTAHSPTGLYAHSKGWVSVKLDSVNTQINLKVSEIKIIN